MGHPSAVVVGIEAPRWASTRRVVSALVVWSVWAIATLLAIWYIGRYTRNIPYFDDFTVIPVMTGDARLTLEWLSTQYNEHRSVVPKLIQALLLRAVPDFRAGLYLNAGLLSAAAASALLLARRLRGESRVVDAVLPLSILTLGQCECLLVGFALNLVMTAWLAWEMIALIGRSAGPPGWWSCLRIGGALVLLPLCGGSGIAMLPPLALWLAGYAVFGWRSGRDLGPWARAIGLVALAMTSAIVVWYLSGYERPAHIPAPPSVSAAWSTTVEACSLVFCPIGMDHRRAAGLTVVVVSVATMILLATVAWRTPEQRPRALGLIAALLSTLAIDVAVGYSRSGLGPGSGAVSRYITIAMPLLGVVYFAWLIYGKPTLRRLIHIALLALICAGIPAQVRSARAIGRARRQLYVRIEDGLQSGMPASRLLDLTCPNLYPDRAKTYQSFQMLKQARVGKFRYLSDEDRRSIGLGDRSTLR